MFNRNDYVTVINEHGQEVLVHKNNFTAKQETIVVSSPESAPEPTVEIVEVTAAPVVRVEKKSFKQAHPLVTAIIDKFGRKFTKNDRRSGLLTQSLMRITDVSELLELNDCYIYRLILDGKLIAGATYEAKNGQGILVHRESVNSFFGSADHAAILSEAAQNRAKTNSRLGRSDVSSEHANG